MTKPSPKKAAARLAVFCSGNGSNFGAILDAIQNNTLKASVAVMVCDNPEAFAISRAQKAGVPVFVLSPKLFSSREEYEKVVVQALKSQSIDLVVLAGFMRILTPYFIGAFRNRIMNVHPSLLPAFKGAHAIRDAWEAKVPETGVSIHVVTEDLDSGPILAQERVPIAPGDTLESLEAKIHAVEHRLYPAAVQKYLTSL